MKLKELGEFGLIERFTPKFKSLIGPAQIGIGDDCAVIPANGEEDWLVTTDLLTEGVHFLRNAITPWQLGYKSLAVSLSDIAAMGGIPTGSFLSIAIPQDISVEYMDYFMDGYRELSKKYRVPLLGGDTTKSEKHLTINVCVHGKCAKGKARMRGMAQLGDLICVTGSLGDSAAGLKLLLEKKGGGASESAFLLRKHHQPEPRLAEGQFLSECSHVHAMIDLSDGIASDLIHVLKASGRQAIVETDRLPLSRELSVVATEYQWDTTSLAVAGGEDYELLFTVSADEFASLNEAFSERFGRPIHYIGCICKGAARIQWLKTGVVYPFAKKGFNHFA